MKYKLYLFIMPFLMAMLTNNLFAIPKRITKLCNSGATQDLNECMSYKYNQAMQKQRIVYEKSLALAVQDDKNCKQLGLHQEITSINLFKKSQKTWEVYQKQYCHIIGNTYRGGSMQDMEYLACMANLTNMRTDMVRTQNQFSNGDYNTATLDPG